MRASLYLINKYFWKSPLMIVFSFVVPILFIVTACLVWSILNTIQPILIMPAISYIPIVCISLVVMPMMIFNFKNSQVLRRMNNSNVSVYNFIFVFIVVFTALMFVSYFFCLSLATFVFIKNDAVLATWKTANWGNILYTMLLVILMSSSIGITVGLLAKSAVVVQIITITILMLTAFLGF
ncbi:hypothetical protein Barb6_03805 [Bacteroidales bacterium Barb6]|nr:hypothetical protein Barb6_03805 [Bacteroidales bacterium Barb6]